MTNRLQRSPHTVAVEVYGEFLHACILENVAHDRVGESRQVSANKIDGRPVRLLTLSGKGGWSDDPNIAEEWSNYTNISLLDHSLSVARGALMFYVIQASEDVGVFCSWDDVTRLAYALVSIAFLHDIDKDLQLERGSPIPEASVAERMSRYGIDSFLSNKGITISPAAMLNYIEEVEGSQAARSPAAIDYDRKIAAMSSYVEVADKLEGIFLDQRSDISSLISSLENLNQWPILKNTILRHWEVIQIHDHIHTFLLDQFQIALSSACKNKSGLLPLIEVVHDGVLLCIIPRAQSQDIREEALQSFIDSLPFRLRFSVNNRLASEFVGGRATWELCRKLMGRTSEWDHFRNLFALPRGFVTKHVEEINSLLRAADLETSWVGLDEGATGATVKPFGNHPNGSRSCFPLNSDHALAFLTITLNHKDKPGKNSAPDADTRQRELSGILDALDLSPPEIYAELANDPRAQRTLLAMWTISKLWGMSLYDEDSALKLFNDILGHEGLTGTWLEGNMSRIGISDQVIDNSSDINHALERRFGELLSGKIIHQHDREGTSKRCFLCNVPTSHKRKVSSSLNVHGVKVSAFSGRDGRNDHLASPSGDTHLCLVCQAELKLRFKAQAESKGSNNLPPLISSPVTTGLFGGLIYEQERDCQSLGLNEILRLNMKKGKVYMGLDVQMKRTRIARLENLPPHDAKLVVELRKILQSIQRIGRPIHLFQGAPNPHPAIFYSDALPRWLVYILQGDSLRIEQLDTAISNLEFFEIVLSSHGLGVEWAKRMADPEKNIRLGAFCVTWVEAIERIGSGSGQAISDWIKVAHIARHKALTLIHQSSNNDMKLADNTDPLIRLAWLATRIQKRIGSKASISKQLLCWSTAVAFLSSSRESITNDQSALILGLAAKLEENLTRGISDAAAKKYRDGLSLQQACIDFAHHFVLRVWVEVFKSKEPTSQDQRNASAIYRFALLESYRERGISESEESQTNHTPTLIQE